jgi:hypothetical protein
MLGMIWINEQRGEHAAQRPGDMPADNVVSAAQLDQLTGDLSRYGANLIVAGALGDAMQGRDRIGKLAHRDASRNEIGHRRDRDRERDQDHEHGERLQGVTHHQNFDI